MSEEWDEKKDVRGVQKSLLKSLYPHYDPKRHTAFWDHHNKMVERTQQLTYQWSRGLLTIEGFLNRSVDMIAEIQDFGKPEPSEDDVTAHDWAEAIFDRLTDVPWHQQQFDDEEREKLRGIISRAIEHSPELQDLIGTGLIEEDYWEADSEIVIAVPDV